MKKGNLFIALLCVPLVGSPALSQAQSAPQSCKALVETGAGFYLVSEDGRPVAHFPPTPVEASEVPDADDQLFPVALSPSGRRIAFIPNGPGNTFVIMDDKGHRLIFPSNLPATNAEHDLFDGLGSSSKRFLEGIAWTSDGVIRLEKDIASINNERFEFYRFVGHSNQLTQVARPSFGITCAASPVGGHVACLDAGLHGGIDNDVELDGSFINSMSLSDEGIFFSNSRNSATRSMGSVTLSAGESASIPGTHDLRVHVLSVKNQVTFRVVWPTGYWDETSLPVGTPDEEFFDDAKTILELLPTKIDSATGKVTMKVFVTPAATTGFAGDIAWMPDHEGIVTVRNSPQGPELVLLKVNERRDMRVAASAHVAARKPVEFDGAAFLDPVSASELYYQYLDVANGEASLSAGLFPLETDPHTGNIRFGKPIRLPSQAKLKLGQRTSSLPVLTWSCH